MKLTIEHNGEVYSCSLLYDDIYSVHKHFNRDTILGKFSIENDYIHVNDNINLNLLESLKEKFKKVINIKQEINDDLERMNDNIPEIYAPLPKYYDNHPNIETLNSCIESTDYVMAISRRDPEVLLMRILQNQKTIMTVLELGD